MRRRSREMPDRHLAGIRAAGRGGPGRVPLATRGAGRPSVRAIRGSADRCVGAGSRLQRVRHRLAVRHRRPRLRGPLGTCRTGASPRPGGGSLPAGAGGAIHRRIPGGRSPGRRGDTDHSRGSAPGRCWLCGSRGESPDPAPWPGADSLRRRQVRAIPAESRCVEDRLRAGTLRALRGARRRGGLPVPSGSRRRGRELDRGPCAGLRGPRTRQRGAIPSISPPPGPALPQGNLVLARGPGRQGIRQRGRLPASRGGFVESGPPSSPSCRTPSRGLRTRHTFVSRRSRPMRVSRGPPAKPGT